MQDMNKDGHSCTVYLKRQVVGSDDLVPQSSIMFSESRHLSVIGTSGSVVTELIKIEDKEVALGRVTSTGHEIELNDSGNFTFLLPTAGRLDIQISGTEYRSLPGMPLAFRPTERRTRASPGMARRFRATTLQVSFDRLNRLASRCENSASKAFSQDADRLSGPVGQYLARQLPVLVDDILLRPEAVLPPKVVKGIAGLIDDQLCEFLCIAVENQSARRVLSAFHRVRQAEEVMHARSDEPLSMQELAEQLGVCLRSLQLGFIEVHGFGPRDVLNRIRLEKARQRLLAANEVGQVTTIALDCGFFHLSRFAQVYARTYGERPSETLARRRA